MIKKLFYPEICSGACKLQLSGENLVSDAYKEEKSHPTYIWLFKTFSMVMFYLHFTHALQLRQIRVDFVNQVHFQILDRALER